MLAKCVGRVSVSQTMWSVHLSVGVETGCLIGAQLCLYCDVISDAVQGTYHVGLLTLCKDTCICFERGGGIGCYFVRV